MLIPSPPAPCAKVAVIVRRFRTYVDTFSGGMGRTTEYCRAAAQASERRRPMSGFLLSFVLGYRWLDRASFAPPYHPVPWFSQAPAQRHRPRTGLLHHLRGDGYRRTHPLRRSECRHYDRPCHQRDGRLSAPRPGLRSLLKAPIPDASPPRWMESVASMSPAKAFGFGMALFPVQIKNLAIFIACVELIAAASLGS